MGIFYDTMYGKNKKEENGKTETVPSSVNPTTEDTGIKSTSENPALDVASIKSGYAISSGAGKSESSESDKYLALQKEYLDKYFGRGDFSYDVNTDELYKQFREQELESAEKARRNATAQAAGLTGGYGSTYASMAGNAAYSDIMDNADAMMPEFMELARQKYDNEGAELLSRAELAGDYATILEQQEGSDTKAILELMSVYNGDLNESSKYSTDAFAAERTVKNTEFKYKGNYKQFKGKTTAYQLVSDMLNAGLSKDEIMDEISALKADNEGDGYRFDGAELDYIASMIDSHETSAYLGSLTASNGTSLNDYYSALIAAFDRGELSSDEVIYALTSWEDKNGKKLNENMLAALIG